MLTANLMITEASGLRSQGSEIRNEGKGVWATKLWAEGIVR